MPNTGRLVWDQDGQRLYETGVDRGVVYPKVSGAYPEGFAWNGLTAVNERPSGADSNPIWADNMKYLNLRTSEEFGATIEAYTYPDAFVECDGSADVATGVRIGQQKRRQFGFVYRTLIGNDEDDIDYGYKLHIVYGCDAAPSEKNRQTVNESPDAISFSWEISTTPVKVEGYRPFAHIEIDSTKVDSAKLTQLENILYGVDADATASPAVAATTPRLPLPAEVFAIFGWTPSAG